MARPTRRDYDAFHWLPLGRWNESNLLGPRLNEMIFCKICDKYITYKERETHVTSHAAQMKRYLADDRKKAKAARLEAARLAREMKKLAGNS